MNIQDLRRVAFEMFDRWLGDKDLIIPQVDFVRWRGIIHEFTVTPRCPSCGTSVEPELMLLANIDSGDTWACECPACQHEGPQADNEQDALKAFYGEGE